MSLLSRTFLGNDFQTWLIALGIAAAVFVVLGVIQRILRGRTERIAAKTRTVIDDAIVGALQKTKQLYLLVLSVFVGSAWLALPEGTRSIFWRAMVAATLVQGGLWLSAALDITVEHYRREKPDSEDRMTLSVLNFLARLAVWATVTLLILDNLGIDVTALVAGLGIGGVAVALAIQNILGDLFASLSIVLDKPFVLGDFIAVGDLSGSVERIGIKTTRIRSISGEQLVFANGDLLSSRIRNFGRMEQRRVSFRIGVTYETPPEKLERIPAILRAAIEAEDKTRFDRSHFASYGDSSLDFETVYYVDSAEYGLYMDIQQSVNLAVYRRFAEEGIEFAYPTRKVLLHKD